MRTSLRIAAAFAATILAAHAAADQFIRIAPKEPIAELADYNGPLALHFDVPGVEAYSQTIIGDGTRTPNGTFERVGWSIVARVPDGEAMPATGFRYSTSVMDAWSSWREGTSVSMPPDGWEVVDSEGAEDAFYRSRALHTLLLLRARATGAAVLRAQFEDSLAHLPEEEAKALRERQGWEVGSAQRADIFGSGAMNLMSGGRAVEENLALDLALRVDPAGKTCTVALDTITGITVREFDWKALLAGQPEPELDDLAAFLPADNASVLVREFAALPGLVDQFERIGNPLADLGTKRSTDQQTGARLQRQLLLPLDDWARTAGSAAVGEMAISADDLYFVDGTGVAVVLRAKNPIALRAFLLARQEHALLHEPRAERRAGEAAGIAYTGVVTPTRGVCSYLLEPEPGIFVVANSLPLLERIVRTRRGEEASLAGLDEYRYFRTLYPRGDGKEDAFALLTDGAIRKWCGPRWRIAQSRRVRAAAALSHLTATQSAGLLDRAAAPEKITSTWSVTGPTEVLREAGTLRQAEYGSLEFLTPIAELPLDAVKESEAAAYNQFRNSYQNRWTRFFDPIAIRVQGGEGLAMDMTVMPLIAQSDYTEIRAIAGTGSIAPTAGDTHAEARAHGILHIDQERVLGTVRPWSSGFEPIVTSLGAWLGDHAEVYSDESAYWEGVRRKVAAGERPYADSAEETAAIPVGVRIASRSALSLAAFVSSVRTMVDQSAPGLVRYTVLGEPGREYVAVEAADPNASERYRAYYHAGATGLTLSFNEGVIQRAAARSAGDTTTTLKTIPTGGEWLGGTASFAIDGAILPDIASMWSGSNGGEQLRQASYANLPILNHWRRIYPDRDPVAVHRDLFGTVLECPGGKGYRWNAELMTMESAAFGVPGAPRGDALEALPKLERVEAGIDLGEDRLRARMRVR